MMTSESRNLNTHPSNKWTLTSSRYAAGYTRRMRVLGYGLIVVTLAFVALLAATARPSRTSGDIAIPRSAPQWNGIYAKAFPACSGDGSFIPARIVVVPREGAAQTMRYSDATIARINASWDNEDPTDDLYTIGKCAR